MWSLKDFVRQLHHCGDTIQYAYWVSLLPILLG